MANHVLGFDGWSSQIINVEQDYCEEGPPRKFSAAYSAIVRVTLKNGASHEGIGYGECYRQSSKGSAIHRAKKSAVTDARKRAIRLFGNVLGNSLYDKNHLRKVRRDSTAPKDVLVISNKIYYIILLKH